MTKLYTTGGNPIALYTTGGVRVMGPPAESGESDIDPSTLTTLRQVTDNTAYTRTQSTVDSRGETIITAHTVRRPAKAIQLQHTNKTGGVGGPAPTQDLILRAGFEIAGTYHPVTFGGEFSVTVEPGTRALSDTVGETVIVKPGDVIYSIVEMASGRIGNGGYGAPGGYASKRYPGRYQPPPGTLNSGELAGSPSGIYGLTTDDTLSVVIVGDSFSQQGWPRAGVDASRLAWSDWSVWLDRTSTDRLGLLADRMPGTGPIPYDVALVFWGGNDRTTDLDAWNRKSIASWRLFEAAGCKVVTKTLHPYTSSTDGWTTTEGQSYHDEAQNEVINARNAWLRDGAPIDADDAPLPAGTTAAGAIRIGDASHPVTFPAFDESDATSSARDSGIWRVDGGAWSADGIHLSNYGVFRLSEIFAQWVADNLT